MATARMSARAKAARTGAARGPKAATPWGPAVVVEEAKAAQKAGDKQFTTVCQLLELASGEQLVRIAYTSDGIARRGPVTLRARDVARLNAAVAAKPRLAAALGREQA